MCHWSIVEFTLGGLLDFLLERIVSKTPDWPVVLAPVFVVLCPLSSAEPSRHWSVNVVKDENISSVSRSSSDGFPSHVIHARLVVSHHRGEHVQAERGHDAAADDDC